MLYGFILGSVITLLCVSLIKLVITCFSNSGADKHEYSDGDAIIKNKCECVAENIDTILALKEQKIKDSLKARERAWSKIQEKIECGLRTDNDNIEIKLSDISVLTYSEIRKVLKRKGYKVTWYSDYIGRITVVIKLK